MILRDPTNNIAEELRVVMCNLNLEQLTRIWEALQQPYRLSICYQIRVTEIDSRRDSTNARIIERSLFSNPGLPQIGSAA
jgi:hypothetical protein